MGAIMGRPRNPNPPINTGIVKQKRPNGWTYVYERKTQYDHETANNKARGQKLLGKLAPGETDISKMVPTRSRKKSESLKNQTESPQKAVETPQEKLIETSRELLEADRRQYDRIKYAAHFAFFVILWGLISGMSSCVQLAEFWNAQKNNLREKFSDFPLFDISHDTIRRFIVLIGKDIHARLLKKLTENMINCIDNITDIQNDEIFKNVYPIDGQAIRASKLEPGSTHSRYVLNIYDCKRGIIINQEVVGEKTNEIKHCESLLEKIDVRGGIITADALNTTKEFAYSIINNHKADYCLAVKGNCSKLYKGIKDIFNNKSNENEFVCGKTSREKLHGRIEKRYVKVARATLLDNDILEEWYGLKYGCIVQIRSEVYDLNSEDFNDKGEIRYYITSIEHSEYIASQMLYIIRSHWHIENKLHWVLDVSFSQDKIQSTNVDFITGITTFNKLAYNLCSTYKLLDNHYTNNDLSFPSIKARMTNLDTYLDYFTKLTYDSCVDCTE